MKLQYLMMLIILSFNNCYGDDNDKMVEQLKAEQVHIQGQIEAQCKTGDQKACTDLKILTDYSKKANPDASDLIKAMEEACKNGDAPSCNVLKDLPKP